MEQPKIINKIERRKSPRVPTVIDIEYCFLPDGLDKINKVTQGYQRMKKKTFTVHISEGGIALITYDKIELRKLVFFSFNIKDNIAAVCSVVRSEPNEGNNNFKTALKFIDMDSNHRNIIAEYIKEKLK